MGRWRVAGRLEPCETYIGLEVRFHIIHALRHVRYVRHIILCIFTCIYILQYSHDIRMVHSVRLLVGTDFLRSMSFSLHKAA